MDEEMMSLKQALNEIHFYRGVIPSKAYEVLSAHQEKVTPLFIQIIKNVVERHNRTGDYYVAHIHALLLLSQFREKTLYPVVIELLNLPIESIDRLIGDMLTETMPKIITSIYDGNPEPLFALLVNHEAHEILRSIIGSCFSALVYQKMIEKELVLLRLQEVVASGKMNGDQAFFTALAQVVIQCKLEPLYDTVRAAFKAGMVLSEQMDIHYFEHSLSGPVDKLTREQYLNPFANPIDELSILYADVTPITPKIERNAVCPCGSGQKFKKCCIVHL